MIWLAHSFLSLAGVAAVHGATVSQEWSLTAKAISPDGFTRSAEVVNGVFPGPLLTANKGDSIVVNVQNNLLDPSMRRSTSIVRTLLPCLVAWAEKISHCSIGMVLCVRFRKSYVESVANI